jgi:hypothetical protein
MEKAALFGAAFSLIPISILAGLLWKYANFLVVFDV